MKNHSVTSFYGASFASNGIFVKMEFYMEKDDDFFKAIIVMPYVNRSYEELSTESNNITIPNCKRSF